MNLILKKYSGLLFFLIGYLILCFLMRFKDLSFSYVMMAWNMLLAALPLFFIEFSMLQYKKNKYKGAIVLGILWLVFFPNAVYMITDLIHIHSEKLVWIDASTQYSLNNRTMYSTKIVKWVKLLIIGIGVIYGLLIGMESLNIFYRFLNKKISKPISYLIIVGVSLISGFAVYIGRFLRLNSWDLLTPLTLVSEVFTNINPFAIEFTIAFAGFILIMFLLYGLFRKIMSQVYEQE